MRGLLFLSFLASCLAFAGCSAPDPAAKACGGLAAELVVDEVHGTDLLVDGRSLVLHAAEATVLLRAGGVCTPIDAGEVRPGDRVGHDATEIATSYPAQAWPEHLVVERA